MLKAAAWHGELLTTDYEYGSLRVQPESRT